MTQRGLLEIVQGAADDGGPNGLYLQATRGIGRIGCNVNRSVAAGDLHLVEPWDLQLVRMLRRVQANASSDGGGSRARCENNLDLRGIEGDEMLNGTWISGTLRIGGDSCDAALRSG